MPLYPSFLRLSKDLVTKGIKGTALSCHLSLSLQKQPLLLLHVVWCVLLDDSGVPQRLHPLHLYPEDHIFVI